jgi:hypothetical protein
MFIARSIVAEENFCEENAQMCPFFKLTESIVRNMCRTLEGMLSRKLEYDIDVEIHRKSVSQPNEHTFQLKSNNEKCHLF